MLLYCVVHWEVGSWAERSGSEPYLNLGATFACRQDKKGRRSVLDISMGELSHYPPPTSMKEFPLTLNGRICIKLDLAF